MRATNKIPVKTKSGSIYPAGTSFDIQMVGPVAVAIPSQGQAVRVRPLLLHKYFNGFIKVNPDKIAQKYENDASVVRSLTGARVEPDGCDEHGFPSVLVACGYV